MDSFVLKSSVLFAVFNLVSSNLELILTYPKKWQYLNKQSDREEELLNNIAKSVDWIIFVVDKPYLRTTEIKKEPPKTEVHSYLLEPYRSLKLIADNIKQRSGKKRKKKVKEDQEFSKDSSDENDSSEEDSAEEGLSEKDFGGLKLTKSQTEMLRKRWRNSCDKRASRICKKACKLSYKNVCKTFRCRRSQKRRFRKECSRNCKWKFLG